MRDAQPIPTGTRAGSGLITRTPVDKAIRAQLPRECASSVAGPTLTSEDTGGLAGRRPDSERAKPEGRSSLRLSGAAM